MCSKENLARRTRDLIEYYFASRGDKSWQRLRRKTKGGVAEPVLSCPPKRSSPRYIFSLRRCIVYILFLSNKNAASLFLSIIDRVRTAYPGISRSINEAALRDPERIKFISHRPAGLNRKRRARSVRNSRPNDACPAAQHSFVRDAI